MADNIIKFGKAKKAIARQAKEKNAKLNRARFGQTKSNKELKKALAEKLQSKLDSHKITPAQTTDAADENTSEKGE